MSSKAASLVLLAWLLPAVSAAEWTVDRDASLFAVVTHKEGVAAGLAHEHFVVATDFQAVLQEGGLFEEGSDAPASFRLEVAADSLKVDDPSLASRWQQPLLDRELIGEPFAELSDKDRRKIRSSMLGRTQLDAESHPTIRAELSEIRSAEEGSYTGTLSLTVRGETASREIEFGLEVDPEAPSEGRKTWRAEVSASFEFGEFGIEPYSAMLGAIRVSKTFHVFAVVVATSE